MIESTDAEVIQQDEVVIESPNMDKVAQIRAGIETKKRSSLTGSKEVIVHGKNFIITGKETKDIVDESTVKKRAKNYVWYESKIGTEKKVDIVNIEKRKGREIKKPKEIPEEKKSSPPKIRVVTHKKVQSSILDNRGSKPDNKYQSKNPIINPISSYRLTSGQKTSSLYTPTDYSKPTQYNPKTYQKPQLQPNYSYRPTPVQKNDYSRKIETLTSLYNPNKYQTPKINLNNPYKLKTDKKPYVSNIGNIGSNKPSIYQMSTIQPRQREIRTPAPRVLQRILTVKKKRDYLDNYQYLEDKNLNNPKKQVIVVHKRLNDLIEYFNEPITKNQSDYNKVTFNPKLTSQQTILNSNRKNNPPVGGGEIIRVSRLETRTPAINTSDYLSKLYNKNITSTNYKPSDITRSKKPETIEKQILSKRIIAPSIYERTQTTNNSGLNNPINEDTSKITVNRYLNSTTVIGNEPINPLKTTQTITTTSRVTRRSYQDSSKPVVKTTIITSKESNTNPSSNPDVNAINKIIKVEIKKDEKEEVKTIDNKENEVQHEPNVEKEDKEVKEEGKEVKEEVKEVKEEVKEVEITSNNERNQSSDEDVENHIKEHDSIRNKYKIKK